MPKQKREPGETSAISEEDVQRAAQQWRKDAPQEWKGLLDAEPEEAEEPTEDDA